MRSFKRVAVIVGLTALSTLAFAEQWDEVKSEDGIKVYLSDVPNPSTRPIAALR